MDTALAIQFKEASAILLQDVKDLMKVLRRQAFKYKWTVMIGRTHGVHAEPITFGLKLALWYQEMARNLARLEKAVDELCVGQISGAVGTFAQISPKVEAYVCRKAGLKPALISNQIIQRDRHAYFFATLAVIASSLEKFAVEVRHLQRTEVQEAEEPFTRGRARRRCRTSETRSSPRMSQAWRGSCGATPWRHWRTFPCGMSGTSVTLRWNG